jgi:hypothetical protein
MIELVTMSIPACQRLTFDILWHLFGYVCPMSASQVSKYWRLVALVSPFIWASITILLDTSERQHILALLYFGRSQSVPITLTIHATRRFNSWEKTALLLPHAHRFRSLHVRASSGSLANRLWVELDTPMPRLDTFETLISNASRISIKRKTVTMDDNVNIIPPVPHLNFVYWNLWNPTGLTDLTLDTTRLFNKPDLDGIYHALATCCQTIQHFEYRGLVNCIDNARLNARTRLEFPELRSLAVLCHDNMAPLLQFMIIPALDSLSLRDFIVYPTDSTIPVAEPMDDDLTFDPDGLFQAIRQWTTITHLEIFGIDDLPSDDLSPPPDLSNYIRTLNQLTSIVLYGIGAATSIAYTLFMYDEEPLLPKLSHFLLAMSPDDDLCNYLIARQRHQLPRLRKLSINLDYARHIRDINRTDILWSGCEEIFVFADPEVGKFIPIKEVNLLEMSPQWPHE